MAFVELYGEREEVDRATASGGFTNERSEFTRTLIFKDVKSEDDLLESIRSIVGTTFYGVSAGTNAGKLTRVLPKSDPQFAYMVASAIQRLQGIGSSVEKQANQSLEVAAIDKSYGLWEQYDAIVHFTQRPYPIFGDRYIEILNGVWASEQDYVEGQPHPSRTYKYANEWIRYTLMDRKPKDDWVTASQGEFVFEAGAGSTSGANGNTASGQIRQYLNNSDITITWIGVPMRYILSTNCYFDKYRGRVNQNLFSTPWYDWYPGELLYLNYSYKEYVPCVAEFSSWFITDDNKVINSLEKLCDITLYFMETRRELAFTDTIPNMPNRNIVVGGHNLLPWHKDRLFHFGRSRPVTPGATDKDRYPAFYSFPVEILFTDPDFPQPLLPNGRPSI